MKVTKLCDDKLVLRCCRRFLNKVKLYERLLNKEAGENKIKLIGNLSSFMSAQTSLLVSSDSFIERCIQPVCVCPLDG